LALASKCFHNCSFYHFIDENVPQTLCLSEFIIVFNLTLPLCPFEHHNKHLYCNEKDKRMDASMSTHFGQIQSTKCTNPKSQTSFLSPKSHIHISAIRPSLFYTKQKFHIIPKGQISSRKDHRKKSKSRSSVQKKQIRKRIWNTN